MNRAMYAGGERHGCATKTQLEIVPTILATPTSRAQERRRDVADVRAGSIG